jgi:hypothetical protein
LALAYLVHGRFDSAIAVLEQGQRACPAGDPMSKYFGVFAEDARNVKASLTAARDALREQGVSTTYPDERIFFAALAAADPKDDFLVLNLADAFAGAMPESVTAWRCVADMNLGYQERHTIGESRVPQMRAKAVLIRGRQALEKMWRLDNKASYPAMRMMQHVLLTTSPPDPRRAVSRDEVPGLFSMADPNSIYTDRELAFLNFGKAVFYVKGGGGWEVSIMDRIISWLDKAVALDPATKTYAQTLEFVRSNRAQIERLKLQKGREERAQAEAFARKMFAPLEEDGPDAGERIVGGIVNGAWWIAIESLKSKGTLRGDLTADAMKQMGCVACWGSGKTPYIGDVCRFCGGDGEALE